MEFCEECGGMLVSSNNEGDSQMECRNCGTIHEVDGDDYKVTETKEEDPKDRLNVNDEDSDESTRPTTTKECPSCGDEQEHEWWMEQTRASDEPPTRFYKCRNCGNVHKEYD
jgi:DNA-directed RNA polymerase subunit M